MTACADAGYNVNKTACKAVFTENENLMLDLHKEFDLVLLLLFVGYIVSIAAGLIRIVGLSIVANLLSLGGLVGFAGFIMLHIYRFRAVGKFCAGDYASDSSAEAPLWSKGNLLLGMMITTWSFVGLFCLCACCIPIIGMLGWKK